MGNNSFALILGYNTAIISLNGKKIIIRNCLHVLDLHNPLYSLRAHQQQCGCGFIGFHVFFPRFILEVDTAMDCHLVYALVGQPAGLPDLNYVQPKFPPKPSALTTPATGATSTDPVLPAIMAPDTNKSIDGNGEGDDVSYAPHWPKRPPTPPPPAISPESITPVDCARRLNNMTTHR